MAKITSSVSGVTTTYVITDQAGNTATVTAVGAPPGQVGISTTGLGLLLDGQALLTNLMQMLETNLRPNVIPGTTASLSN